MMLVSMKRVMALTALGVLACSEPALAINYANSGTIANLRNYTLRHPNGLANGYTMIQLSTPLQGGCTWGFIDAADKNALAIVLAARAAGTPVTVTYDNSVASPWGDAPVCAVLAIEMN